MLTGIRQASLGCGRQDPRLQDWAGLGWTNARLSDPVPVPGLEIKKIENLSFNSTCSEQRRYVLGEVRDLVRALASS